MKLSVIIPVYHTVHTLEASVDSVLSQGVSDMEVILVDDGSGDKSSDMCDALAERYDNVYAIHAKHRGAYSARNAGLSLSAGEYVMFLDSDDTLAPYTLPVLLARLGAHPEYDILEYPLVWHYGSDEECVMKFGKEEYVNMRDYWLSCQAYTHCYACNKIFRRSLFDEVSYPPDRTFADAAIYPSLLDRCRVVATTEEGGYRYHPSPTGLLATADGAALGELLEVHVGMLERYGLTEEPTEYYLYVLDLQLSVYSQTKEPPILPELTALSRQAIKALPVSRREKHRLRRLKLLGIHRLCKLHRLRHKLRRSR